MLFRSFTSPLVIAVDVAEFAFQLFQSLAERHSVPSQFFMRLHRATCKHRLHDLRHEMSALVSAEARLRFVEHFSYLWCQFSFPFVEKSISPPLCTLIFLVWPKVTMKGWPVASSANTASRCASKPA